MGNEEARSKLASLRARTRRGEVWVEDVGQAFEALTLSLMGVSKDDESLLHDLVNDIERIRFTQLPETQGALVDHVFERAQPIFDRAGS